MLPVSARTGGLSDGSGTDSPLGVSNPDAQAATQKPAMPFRRGKTIANFECIFINRLHKCGAMYGYAHQCDARISGDEHLIP